MVSVQKLWLPGGKTLQFKLDLNPSNVYVFLHNTDFEGIKWSWIAGKFVLVRGQERPLVNVLFIKKT